MRAPAHICSCSHECADFGMHAPYVMFGMVSDGEPGAMRNFPHYKTAGQNGQKDIDLTRQQARAVWCCCIRVCGVHN